MTAAACLETLAKAMQGSFARYRELVVGLMLERLKERKANVTDSIGDALDAVFSSVRPPFVRVKLGLTFFRLHWPISSLILGRLSARRTHKLKRGP
jgi:hypothetical protein